MYSIKLPAQFITTPWKNGLGETTELAINEGGTLADFDWRISMATVNQDGEFSNFDGYFRQLTLIKGNGIKLHHQNKQMMQKSCDNLVNLLDIAEFDGGYTTYGELVQGGIVDFNVITKAEAIESNVTPVVGEQSITLATDKFVLIYAVASEIAIVVKGGQTPLRLAQGELFQWLSKEHKQLELTGRDFIIVELAKK